MVQRGEALQKGAGGAREFSLDIGVAEGLDTHRICSSEIGS